MVFGKKKKTKKDLRREQLRRVVRKTQIKIPTKGNLPRYPREYKEFLAEYQKKPTHLYEKACALAEKVLPINPGKDIKEKYQQNLSAAFIFATPKGAFSLAILSTLIALIGALVLILFEPNLTLSLFVLLFVGGVFYYFYTYPETQAKVMRLRMSSDAVLAILYMVIYMRSSPNLEGALKFAAGNLSGPLSRDLKKLIWDIEVGTFSSADSALVNYIHGWKDNNREFSEALHLLRGVGVNPERRKVIFQETINVILDGTRERTRHYAAGLRMPMMLIHAMGVLLPVMGLVLFPVILIFLSDTVKPVFIFLGYNVILPLALIFFMNYILQTKPPTFSQPDLSRARNIPPIGKFAIGKSNIPLWPISVLILIPFLGIGLLGFNAGDVFTAVNYSLIIVLGISFSIAVFCLLDSYQKIKLRNDIERIEDEFSVALFQLGNTISAGVPIEIAIDQSMDKLKDLKIANLFAKVSLNMRKFGYTFEQALMDKNVGAIWDYPSKLIESVMKIVIQSSRKSARSAADSMIVISNYLKSIHNVKEEIGEILGETISSMKFLAMFLAPLVAGITVTMAVIILQILTNLGTTLGGIVGTSEGLNAAQLTFLLPSLASGGLPITPPEFQMIVGIYMIETAIILATLLNRIEYGEDIIGERSSIGKILVISSLVYFVSWLVVFSMFGSSIAAVLNPV